MIFLKRSLFILVLLLVFSPAQAGWQAAINGCSVFDRDAVTDTQIVVAAGPMRAKADTSGYERNFRPHPTVHDAGHLQTTVYDCSQKKTAWGIAADLRRRLRSAGWHVDYGCSGEVCGPAEAWAELFPMLRTTPARTAYSYGAAHRIRAGGIDRFILFAADIDERPRVIVQRLKVNPASPVKQELDLMQAIPLYQKQNPLVSLNFKTASSRLDEKAKLENLNHPRGARWVVVGHADPRGAESRNALLSWQRARSVVTELTALGVPSHAISFYAVGDVLASPAAKDFDHQRRVDVFQTMPESNSTAGSDSPEATTKPGGPTARLEQSSQ